MLATASTVWGSLPTWILVAMAIAVAWRVTRGGGGAAVGELERANSVLTRSLHEEREAHQSTKDQMGAEIRDLRIQVANLEGKTDVALAINAWGEQHEMRAAERHIATLRVLDLIAGRLGKDPTDG